MRFWTPLLLVAMLSPVPRVDAESARGRSLTLVSIHEDLLPGVRAVLDDFQRQTGHRVRAQAVPYRSHELWIRTQLLGGNPPDVLLVEETALPWSYGRAGLLEPLEDALAEPNRFSAGAASGWAAFKPELVQQARDPAGRLWLVPYTQFGVGFFYDRSAYQALDLQPPATWEQLLDNFARVQASGRTALVAAVRSGDGQTEWMADMILELLLRPVAEKVNRRCAPGWHYDPLDPESTRGEAITLEERLAAFDRGWTDPARSPAFAEMARLVKNLVRHLRADFASLDGAEVPRTFARGQSVHYLNGTWYLRPLAAIQRGLSETAPERVFPWGVFPFPELTSQSTPLPRWGGIHQNSGLRACFIVPIRPKDPARRTAAIDLVRFLTSPQVASVSFHQTDVYDLPAMLGVAPKPEAEPLVPRQRFAYLPLARVRGYDARSEEEFWTLWQGFLSQQLSQDVFLTELSGVHRRSLRRLVQSSGASLDREFLAREGVEGWQP